MKQSQLIRVLVADDHSVVRAGVRSILSAAPEIEVVGEAANSLAAIEQVGLHHPDVVLLDIQMPGGGGLETLRVLRRDHPEIAVLVMSFHPERIFALPFLREGACGYLSKDRVADDLIEAIHRVRSGHRYLSDEVVETLARRLSSSAEISPHDTLSAQELIVLSLLASGRSTDQIGTELQLGRRTVQRCCNRILRKTRLQTLGAAVQYALNGDIQRRSAG